ncbi:MAG: HEAT repeat domain-containing protein [Elusimicrobia bacterium]|nr:HEAT repeat domain-containing protein [Elusimicrobiota bacterium]
MTKPRLTGWGLPLGLLLLAASQAEAARQKNFRRTRKAAAAAPAPLPAPRPAVPPTVCESVNRIFLRVDALVAEQAQKDAKTFSRVDRIVREYKAPITGLGPAAVPCLASIALDPMRLEKSRLWALTFLTFIKRRVVFNPVRALLLDQTAPVELRSTAASYLPLLKGFCDDPKSPEEGSCVTRQDIDATLCASLEDGKLPAVVLREVLSRAARSGCEQAGPIEAWIRSFGDHPMGKDWENAHLAVLALTRAKSPAATRVLLRLFKHYPAGSRGRKLLYKALLEKKGDLLAVRETATPMLTWALRSEPGPVGEIMALEALALSRDPDSAGVFLDYLQKKDPEVVAAAASGLAAARAKSALPTLEKLLAEIPDDPRFQADGEHARPREAVGRIRIAIDDLWRQ